MFGFFIFIGNVRNVEIKGIWQIEILVGHVSKQ